jgi:hypothetical protein
VETPGPVSLDLNPADGDQAQNTQGGVRPGRTVTVQLFVRAAPPATGYAVRLDYDPKALKPGSFTAGTFIPGLIAFTNAPSAGAVEVGGASLTRTAGSGDGYLGAIPFEVLDGFSGQTSLAAVQVSFNQVAGSQQTVRQRVLARLSEAGGLPGDFTGDGVVDFADFFAFANAFGTQRGQPGFDSALDLDNSGEIGFGDFFIFANQFGKRG